MKKKTNRKALLIALSVALAAVMAVGGTIAWLMARDDPVVNTFKTYDITVSIDETTGGTNHDEFHVMPGTEEAKDPKVTVETNMPAYVFVMVEDNTGGIVSYTVDAANWTQLVDDNGDDVAGVYYHEITATEQPLSDTMRTYEFDVLADNKVNYDDTITKDSLATALAAANGAFHLSFTPCAIQSMGFEDEACPIYAAWLAATT